MFTILALLALTLTFAFGMAITHQGAVDASLISDLLLSQGQSSTLALAANSVLPQGAITGALDVVLINTANTPGTQTTRTAAQIYADLTAAFGIQVPNGFAFFLSIVHGGTGTLTLAGGTGVTLSSAVGGATSVATLTQRDYVVTIVNPTTITIVATGSRNA